MGRHLDAADGFAAGLLHHHAFDPCFRRQREPNARLARRNWHCSRVCDVMSTVPTGPRPGASTRNSNVAPRASPQRRNGRCGRSVVRRKPVDRKSCRFSPLPILAIAMWTTASAMGRPASSTTSPANSFGSPGSRRSRRWSSRIGQSAHIRASPALRAITWPNRKSLAVLATANEKAPPPRSSYGPAPG